MKIASINKTNYENNVSPNKTSMNSYPSIINNTEKDSVSFGGAAEIFRNGSTGFFSFIEKAGFFVEFLIVDAISMIAPRICVGLNRDKDKLGHFNYKAGAEEAGREILSGPSMNLIPMGILALVAHYKQASHMSRETLSALDENMKEIIKNVSSTTNKNDLDKALAEKVFNEAFADKNVPEKLKTKFIDMLTNSSNVEKKLFNKEVFKNNTGEFESLVDEISNIISGKEAPSNPKAFKIKNNTVLAGDLYADFANYSKDIISKLSKADFSKEIEEGATKFLETLKNNRMKLKTASAITSFIAVGSFLLYIPKLYQRGKVSPAQESAMRAKAEVEGGSNENK